MASSQSIGNLAIVISADARAMIQAFNEAQDRADAALGRMTTSVNQTVGKTGEQMAKMGMHVLLGAHAYSLLRSEVQHVMENIDKIPGIPPETIASVERMRGAMTLARNTMDGWIAKGLQAFSDFGTAIGIGLGQLIYGEEAAEEGLRRLNAEMSQIKTTEETAEIKRLGEELRKLGVEYDNIYASRARSIEGKRAEGEGMVARGNGIGSDTVEGAKLRVAGQRMINTAKREEEQMQREMNRLVEQYGTLRGKAQRAELPLTTRLLELNKEINAVQRELGSANLERMYQPKNVQALERTISLQEKLNDLTREQATLNHQATKWIRDIGDAFGSNFEEGILQGKRLSGVLGDLAKDLQRILLQQLITKPLAGFITSGLSAMFGLPIPAHAGGGNMNGPAIVGEEGPELVVPSTSSLVIPHSATMGMVRGGNNGPTIFADMRGASVDAVQRLEQYVRSINGSLEQRAIAAVADYQRRGVSPGF